MLAFLVTLSLAVAAAQEAPDGVPLAAPDAQVPHEAFELGNGLKVVLAPDSNLPQVEVMVWYGVGAKDERPGRSGFAHLFEHLMFMGTDRVPDNGYDAILEAGGGRNNGSTSYDQTVFFASGPSGLLHTMLWLEADRMESIGAAVTQAKLDIQRRVVDEERREGQNRPYAAAERAIAEIMYTPDHPYHGLVIGNPADLQAATLDDVQAFFDRYYRPNNALLAVVGDFDPNEARGWIDELFGDLQPGSGNPRPEPVGGLLGETLEVDLHDDVELPRISRVYHSPAYFMPGDAEMDVVAWILGNERTGRLYRRLVMDERLAVNVDGGQASGLLGSLFRIDVYARADADLERVAAIIDEEVERLRAEGPGEDEVRQAVAAIELNRMLQLESPHGRASALLHYWFATRRTDAFERDAERFRSLDPALVGHFCRRLLMPDRRLEVTVRPESSRGPASARDRRPPPAAETVFDPPQPTITRRDSGSSVWSLPRPGPPVVSLRLVFPGGRRTEPEGAEGLAVLTAACLLEGAGDLDGPELQRALEALGTHIDVSVDAGDVTFMLTVLKRNLQPAVELLADTLQTPRLDPAVLADIVALKAEQAAAALDDPETVARQVALAAWFGADHPYGAPSGGTPEGLAALRMDQVQAYAASLLRSEGAVLMVVGDVDAEEVTALADRLDVGGGRGPVLPERPTPDPEPGASRLILVDRPGATQTTVRVVAAAKPGHGPTWLGTEALNVVLGGSFGGRLNQNLRLDKGYTYWAASAVDRWPDQALWMIGSAVRPDVTGAALSELLSEVRRLAAGDVTEAEAAAARAVLLGDLIAANATMSATLDRWLALWQQGAMPSVVDLYVASLPSTTAPWLNELADDVLITDALLIVLVGDAASIVPQLEGLDLPAIEWLDATGAPVPPPEEEP